MAEISMFQAWTMKLPLPEPFQKLMEQAKGKRVSYADADCSCYNKREKGKMAKLHPPTLSAILGLLGIDSGTVPGGCGIQKRKEVDYFLMEYEKEDGTHILVYNYRNGCFAGQVQTEKGIESLPCVSPGKNTGEEYLAVLAYASLLEISPLYDPEFSDHFYALGHQYQNGWTDPKEALHSAFVCCDNLYRRLSAAPEEAIPLEQSQFCKEGKMERLSRFKIQLGIYAPNDHIWGTFQYLAVQNTTAAGPRTIADMKELYSCNWEVPESSRSRIPHLPESYRVSEDAEEILQRIVDTPARMFMLTGSAGGGKTTDAKMIAQILGLPYYVFTCGPDTDELSLLSSTVPNMGKKCDTLPEFPLFEDMQMDPATALSIVSGSYEAGIGAEEAFQKIMEAAYQKGYEQAKKEKDFLLKESEIVKACREACVLEIQEPSAIEKPGTLVRLNSLFDDGACTDLVNGEMLVRNPNTIVIMTTNLNYAGCQAFNASVISRMALVQHREDLSEEDMIQRVMERTGFADEELLLFMASVVKKIQKHLEREEIQGGICGYRELENWVWSYQITGNLLKSVKNTVISKAAFLPEDREILMDTYILPHVSE